MILTVVGRGRLSAAPGASGSGGESPGVAMLIN